MSIIEFCNRHNACEDGRKWALAHCRDMDHAWETMKPEWLIWVATRPGVLDDRTLRLFAVWCARQVQHLMQDARSIAALDVAEHHANGQASDKELMIARDAARAAEDAARDAARAAEDAARDAAWAAGDAAEAAAWAAWAAGADARDAAESAAWAAAESAAWAAARDAARAAQAEWLRANAKPNWEAKP